MTIDNFAIIIGSMKCGTTYLFNYLSQHPEIAPCEPKEPEFFTIHHEQGFEWYESLFQFDPAIHKVALEGSTGYTKYPYWYPNAAAKLQDAHIQAKFIYVVRDPIERVESHYNFGIVHGWSRDRDILDDNAIHCSMYAKQLDEYVKRFPKDDILILNFDDIKADMAGVANRVFRFLGLHELNPKQFQEVKTSDRNYTAEQSAESDFYYQLKQTIRIKGLYQKLLPHTVRTAINSLFKRKLKDKKQLNLAEKQQLVEHLRDDLIRLRDDYQVDISGWSITPLLELRR
ncbi:MAG: sulfotransferase domain-containing protein [Cyanobacteria bacterium J06635_15]